MRPRGSQVLSTAYPALDAAPAPTRFPVAETPRRDVEGGSSQTAPGGDYGNLSSQIASDRSVIDHHTLL